MLRSIAKVLRPNAKIVLLFNANVSLHLNTIIFAIKRKRLGLNAKAIAFNPSVLTSMRFRTVAPGDLCINASVYVTKSGNV